MNAPSQTRLLTDQELARLDELLAAINPDESMLLEELDGFFAALACSPEPVSEDEYLPVVLGLEDRKAAPDDDTPDVAEIRRLLQKHRAAVSGQLFEGEGYSPVLGYDEDDQAHGNAWAVGFVRGMGMRPDAWAVVEEDEEVADALEPVFRLVEEVEPDGDREPEPIADDEREAAIESMLDGVMDIYDYFREQRERNLAPKEPIRRDPQKVGRNDPCPCGSGRKYKACHGADTSH